MALGSQIASHLPFLRRFARSLSGSQAKGDELVRATLESIVATRQALVSEESLRAGLYKVFLDVVNSSAERLIPDSENEDLKEHPFGSMLSRQRQAFLLQAMEGFSIGEVASMLGVSVALAENDVRVALSLIEERPPAKVLIVEDDHLIAMDLATIVSDLGHTVVGVVANQAAAVSAASDTLPDLMLVDVALEDEGSGIAAVEDILQEQDPAVIFITAYPERLLTGERPQPSFMITKPFQRSTVKAAISQALFFDNVFGDDSVSEEPPEEPPSDAPSPVRAPSRSQPPAINALLAEDLSALPSPVAVDVVDGRLAVGQTPQARSLTSSANVEALRTLHLRSAEILCGNLTHHNITPAFYLRLEAVRNTLSQPFDEASGTALGVQAKGLAMMMPSVRDQLFEHDAANIDVLISDLRDLAWTFPMYRDFAQQAEEGSLLGSAERKALTETLVTIASQPDGEIEPGLKRQLQEIGDALPPEGSKFSDMVLVRVVTTIFRAIGRFIQQRYKGIAEHAGKTFDEDTGKVLGHMLSTIVLSGTLAGLIYILPGELKVIPLVLAAIRAAQSK